MKSDILRNESKFDFTFDYFIFLLKNKIYDDMKYIFDSYLNNDTFIRDLFLINKNSKDELLFNIYLKKKRIKKNQE